MNDSAADPSFSGSIPDVYERLLVPVLFEPYAKDLARRVKKLAPERVLEIAAGTGVVTRAIAAATPASVDIIATDLSQPMLDQAEAAGTSRPVHWQQADAQDLPFEDVSFDAVICQFGVMFFPDRVGAYREVARVLRPGGSFILNVWASAPDNDFAQAVQDALVETFPDDPPTFLIRLPFGYHDDSAIRSELVAAGLGDVKYETLDATSRAESADVAAFALCQGPLAVEIEERGTGALDVATSAAAAKLRERYGPAAIEGRMRAYVFSVRKP
jgi:SAM-dependent methyltransferase